MKVLVVGGGGREHAIIEKLSQSEKITKLYSAPGNGGIASLAECVPIGAKDLSAMCAFAREKAVDFVVVAPDDPLVLGMVDEMEKLGIKTFGPNKKAAVIEGSKVFSKELMKKYCIPTASYEVFADQEEATSYLQRQNKYPAVIKAEGLALGKGVVIAKDFAEAKAAVLDMMEKKIFGESGSRVVIEEFLCGPEVSVLAFTDGKTLIPMVSAQDHKRAYDHDQGPNTGGMGAFSPSRVYTPEVADRCMREIFLPTMEAMNKEGRPFTGCLYFGLMLTDEGPKVIEYNSRFGDPETQAVLPRLKTDLFEIFLAISDQRLSEIEIEWHDFAAVCIVLASGGYPQKYETGYEITGLKEASLLPDTRIYHAGTRLGGKGEILTGGGRVLGVTRIGATLDEAIEKAYEAVKLIHFTDMHYRKDIGIK